MYKFELSDISQEYKINCYVALHVFAPIAIKYVIILFFVISQKIESETNIITMIYNLNNEKKKKKKKNHLTTIRKKKKIKKKTK